MKKTSGFVSGLAIIVLLSVFSGKLQAQNPEFEPIWSIATTEATWLGTGDTERAVAYHDGRVYVASRSDGSFVRIVDAEDGSYVGQLNASSLTGGDLPFSALSVSDDGHVFASNLTTNAQNNAFRVYTWENGAVQSVITWNATGTYRMGDNISVAGSVGDGSAVIYASVGTTPVVYRWVMESDGNGGFEFNSDPQEFVLPSTANWGTPAHVAPKGPGEASGFWAGGRSLGYTRSYTASNTTTGFGRFPSDGNGLGNLAINLQSHDGVQYMFFIKGTNRLYVNEVANAGGTWTVRDGTNLAESDVIGINGSNILGDLAVADMGDGSFKVFAMVTNAGLFAFEIRLAESDDPGPDPDPDPVVIDDLPYFEDFSDVNLGGEPHAAVFPEGWRTIGNVQVSGWGEISAQDLRFPSPDANPIAIMPRIHEDIDIDKLKISFKAHYAADGDANDQIDIGFISDPENAATFTLAETVTLSRDVTLYTVELASHTPGDGRRIAIRARRGDIWNSHYVGKIRIYADDHLLMAGASGWRMLSVPAVGATVEILARQNQVQGFAGLSGYYGTSAPPDIETVSPNLYLAYHGTGWTPAAALTNDLIAGKGLLWYMYDNDEGVSRSLPFLLSSLNPAPDGDVEVNLHAVGSGFNLLGNPFAGSLDLSGLTGWDGGDGLQSGIVQVWKNDDHGFQDGVGHQGEWLRFGQGAPEGAIIGAWQGFMVENDDADRLLIPVSARTSGGVFQKETATLIKRLTFVLDGENESMDIRTRDRADLVFSDLAEHGWDLLDASQLTPLAGNFVTLSFVGERRGETILKSQESRPIDFGGYLEIPAKLGVHNMSGDMTITWEGLDDLPLEWQFTLIDHETGISVDLRSAESYEFMLEGSIGKRVIKADDIMPDIAPLTAGDEAQARFSVVVSTEPVSTGPPAELPQSLELAQNYPNPFNPSTVISYRIPEQSHVRLEIYDLTGRRISLLVDEVQAPGRYNVTWDASALSSGVYLYRVTANGHSVTRRMTLVK